MKQIYLLIAVILAIAIGAYLYQQSADSWPPPNVVQETSGQWVLVNELAILSGQDVELLIEEYGGEVTVSVPETGSYQVKFPVSSLEELDIIADKLRAKQSSIQVIHVFVIKPSNPGEPQ